MLKLKVYYKLFDPKCDFTINPKGEMIDLCVREELVAKAPTYRAVNQYQKARDVVCNSVKFNLGIAMKMPKGMEAEVKARSSTFYNYGLILTNGVGEIDSSYCGNNDEWKAEFLCTKDVTIPKYARLVQFKIAPGMFCNFLTRLRYALFGLVFIQVPELSDKDRGGFGSTGV